MQQASSQKHAVAAIRAMGGYVYYDYERVTNAQLVTPPRPYGWPEDAVAPGPYFVNQNVGPSGPHWLRKLLGEDFFREAVHASFVGSQVKDPGLSHVKRMPQLEALGLEGCQITDAGLAQLEGMVHLRALWLNGTEITDAGLAHLRGMRQLWMLHLHDTQITDAGLTHLEGMTKLQVLGLGGTQVTDEGVKTIQQSLPDCRIYR
jgi:hypothetical protein